MLTEKQRDHLRQFASPSRETGFTRSIYSYPAKFLSHLPRELIKMFTQEGDQICDPFVGGGTIALEAMLLNRPFVGYDINPFALLVSRVKTSYISSIELKEHLGLIQSEMNSSTKPTHNYLDSTDKECLGMIISTEINLLASTIKILDFKPKIQDFFNLALIHVTKIVGRRDFEERENWRSLSIVPMFIRKCTKMIEAVSSLPTLVPYPPTLNLGSNHKMNIPNHSIDLIITSPPYLEVDVEYQQIQIQRRSINRSKRTNFINHLLGSDPLPKKELCWSGKSGRVYWNNFESTLTECHRILKPNHYFCLWTGFKKKDYQDKLERLIEKNQFTLVDVILIPQSDNRAASSRSTHHTRDTKMFKQDSIFILRRN